MEKFLSRKRIRPENEKSLPIGVCVKVGSLRPKYSDLEAWLFDESHALVCRRGRVFIGSGDNKRVFVYAGSEFANPFTIKEYGLERALSLYRDHLDKILRDETTLSRFTCLANKSELGCFCKTNERCHRDIIIEKLKTLSEK